MVGKLRFESIEKTHRHPTAFAGDYLGFTSDLLLRVNSIQ